MNRRSILPELLRLPDIRRGEGSRLLVMLALLFFILAANTITKIVRDSVFLSQHTAAELPYLYLLSGFLAGLGIAVYSRYTSGFSLHQLMIGSLVFITLSILVFWYLLAFHNTGWVHYAFYIWASTVFIVAIAQIWTFAEELFTPREGKRLFGTLTAGGTLGGILGGFGAKWSMSHHLGTVHLLWLVVGLLVCALGVARLATSRLRKILSEPKKLQAPRSVPPIIEGVIRLLRHSPYLLSVGALILVSVIVSTLLDFQFKVAAKETYASADGLTDFFASYYGWLSVLTLFAGFALTGQLVSFFGLYPSLFILPVSLLLGSFGFLVFPGLSIATVMRMGDAGLRPTVYRSLTEMLYFPIPTSVKAKAKTFLDVVVERLGDASAGFIILIVSLTGRPESPALVYCCMALVLVWLTLLPSLRRGYLKALVSALTTRPSDFVTDNIDYQDKATVDVIAKVLESPDEESLLLGLQLAESLDPKAILAQLPRSLLRHPSPAVQGRVLKLFSSCPDRRAVDEYLSGISRKDSPEPVIRQALAATGKAKDPQRIKDAIIELHSQAAKSQTREVLIEYGEAAVQPLRESLYDSLVPRAARLNIPRTLSQIDSQAAMDALFAALEHEDGSIRYQVFLALEEMTRRFPNLHLNRAAIEAAIVSDSIRYYKRFVSWYVLFSDWQEPRLVGAWLLNQALLESMERIKQRSLYLLSLIYPRTEIYPAFAALQSNDPVKKAYAVELLDNLLSGKVKRYLFSLFEDTPGARQYQKFLGLLGWESFSWRAAIDELLRQEDAVLTAAAVWEIGLRGLTGFEENLRALMNSDDTIRKETAELVLLGDAFAPTR